MRTEVHVTRYTTVPYTTEETERLKSMMGKEFQKNGKIYLMVTWDVAV